jgi:hypothetical protein
MKVNLIQTALTTTSQVVMPPNPMRFMIILPYSGVNPVFYEFGDQVSGVGVNGYQGNPPQCHLSRDDIGDVITFPVRMWMGTAAANLRFEEISYDPTHYKNWRRMLDEWIADKCP